MRVLVAGDRRWRDAETIQVVLEQIHRLQGVKVVIHGDNGYDAQDRPLWGKPDEWAVRGADKLAGAAAARMGIRVERWSPDWNGLGRSAGPQRNRRMLTEGRPDLVLAFHDALWNSHGTRNLVEQAMGLGVDVMVVSHDGADLDIRKPEAALRA